MDNKYHNCKVAEELFKHISPYAAEALANSTDFYTVLNSNTSSSGDSIEITIKINRISSLDSYHTSRNASSLLNMTTDEIEIHCENGEQKEITYREHKDDDHSNDCLMITEGQEQNEMNKIAAEKFTQTDEIVEENVELENAETAEKEISEPSTEMTPNQQILAALQQNMNNQPKLQPLITAPISLQSVQNMPQILFLKPLDPKINQNIDPAPPKSPNFPPKSAKFVPKPSQNIENPLLKSISSYKIQNISKTTQNEDLYVDIEQVSTTSIKTQKTKKKKYNCGHCSKVFGCQANYERHYRTVHEKSKPHTCPCCEKSFGLKQHLNRHIQQVHSDERPYKCTEIDEENGECGKLFKDKWNLKVHKRIHTGLKPFVCPVVGCGKSFSQKGSYNIHVKRLH